MRAEGLVYMGRDTEGPISRMWWRVPLPPHREWVRASGQCCLSGHCHMWILIIPGLSCYVSFRDKQAYLIFCSRPRWKLKAWLTVISSSLLSSIPFVKSGWQTRLAVHTPKRWREERSPGRQAYPSVGSVCSCCQDPPCVGHSDLCWRGWDVREENGKRVCVCLGVLSSFWKHSPRHKHFNKEY